MAVIQQGDQYNIPFKICFGEDVASPDNVDDVRIKVGEILKEYSAGEIEFDAEHKSWKYPLTEEQSRSVLSGAIAAQVAVKVGTDYIYSATQLMSVGSSIIGEDWDD